MIKGFWAPNHPELAVKFTEGHQNVLFDHGLGFFTSNEKYWYNDEDVYVMLVLHNSDVIAGLRLETKNSRRLLPLEKAIESKDNRIIDFVDRLPFTKVVEVCALWNAKRYAGYNFPSFLCRACLAIAPKLEIDCALSLNGYYTYRIPKDIGCRMVTEVGNNGKFNYPIKRFHSAIWIQEDVIEMKLASKECKELVKDIRENRKFTRVEYNDSGPLEITYNLEE